MLKKTSQPWIVIAALSVGLLGGWEISSWITRSSTTQAAKGHEVIALEQHLVQLDQTVSALTQALEQPSSTEVHSATTCAASPSGDEGSRQFFASLIREELRQALANGTPESRQAKAEEVAIAQALNSPENRAAYQNAASVVQAALTVGRWTDEDGRAFRDAFVQLTNDQRMEVMQLLGSALGRGAIMVDTSGPLF
jgi:hypothetical protein